MIRTEILFNVRVTVTVCPTRIQIIMANPKETIFLSQLRMKKREKNRSFFPYPRAKGFLFVFFK